MHTFRLFGLVKGMKTPGRSFADVSSKYARQFDSPPVESEQILPIQVESTMRVVFDGELPQVRKEWPRRLDTYRILRPSVGTALVPAFLHRIQGVPARPEVCPANSRGHEDLRPAARCFRFPSGTDNIYAR